jgi:ATP-dependent protease HslVU (ClpYQ) peptidase subunit
VCNKGKTLVGCAGTSDVCQKFLLWRNGGNSPKLNKAESFEALVVDSTGIYLFVNSLRPDRIRTTNTAKHFYCAIGSGKQYALGALAVGADPKRAVTVACLFDPFSKPPIELLTL